MVLHPRPKISRWQVRFKLKDANLLRAPARALLIVLITALCVSCGSSTISDEDVIRSIRETRGYPKQVFASFRGVRAASPMGRAFSKFVQDGYLIRQDTFAFNPTEKGKDMFETANWSGIPPFEWIDFRPATHVRDVSRIVDRRVDAEKGRLVVQYETDTQPTPLLQQLEGIDELEVRHTLGRIPGVPDIGPRKEQATFEKWGEGWKQID